VLTKQILDLLVHVTQEIHVAGRAVCAAVLDEEVSENALQFVVLSQPGYLKKALNELQICKNKEKLYK